MKIFERENCFIKDNIPRDVNTSTRHLKTLDPFVARTVADKDTLCGAKGKLAFIIGSQVGPAGTTKNSQ
jgi:hypothetical protein